MKNQVQYYLDNEMWGYLDKGKNGEWKLKEDKPYIQKQQFGKAKRDYSGNNYSIGIVRTRGDIMNDKYRKLFNDKTTLYLYLKANIVRGKMRNDRYNIYNKYYINHQQLACSFSIRYLSEQCNITYYKTRTYINELRKSGLIKVEKVELRDDKDNKRTANIFVLGTYSYIDGKKFERFYLDDELETD